MARMRMYRLVCLLVLICAPAVSAHAEGGLALQEVRTSVASYDLGAGGTLDTLATLTAALADGVREPDVEREVRFLRAAVSADLLFVATYRADDRVRERLSALWGSDGGDLTQRIADALAAADGIYRDPARRMARRLSLVDATGRIRWEALKDASGSWREAALLRRAAEGLKSRGAEQVLEGLADDPCAGVAGGCETLFMPFDAVSRRRMAGLRELGAAMASLRRAEAAGDPLAQLIADDVALDFASVRQLSFRPSPRLREGVRVDAELAKVVPVSIDLLIHVTDDGVEYGYIPRISVDAAGELIATSPGKPSLPAVASVPLPSRYRPYMRPLPAVVEALRVQAADAKVGVTTDHAVPAHVVGRVFLSLRRAGHESAAMLGRGKQGIALGVPLRVVVGTEADSMRRPDVQVRVRLGGYSLKLGGWQLDIPRVRRDTVLHFDTDSLQRKVSRRRIRSAAVSFMGNVAAGNVVAAMWRIAPDADRLNLVMP